MHAIMINILVVFAAALVAVSGIMLVTGEVLFSVLLVQYASILAVAVLIYLHVESRPEKEFRPLEGYP